MSMMLTVILFLSTISFEVFAEDPKVSIIIPVYNTPENLLRDCLNSAKNQTLKDIEIICIDDGSTNGSGEILDEYARSDPARFKVIHQENGGPSVARNKGMEIAQGEYIQFLDSDDTIDPTMSEKCYNASKDYDADIVRCSVKCEERGGAPFFQECHVNNEFKFVNDTNKNINKVLAYNNNIAIFLGVYKNKFLKDNSLRFFDEVKSGQDQCFNILCFSKARKLVFIPDRLYTYRKNDISITARICKGKLNPGSVCKRTDAIKDIYGYFKNFEYFGDERTKAEFLHLILNHRFLCPAISGNKPLLDFFLDAGLLQDDVINQLPIKERIRLKSMLLIADSKTKPEKPIPDGIYTISSKLNPNMCLDINQCSKNDKANLQLWQKNGTNAQKFKVQYNSDGYYTIKAICSGKFIDVSASGKQNGTNIWQYCDNGTDAQKWFIVPDGEGYYCLVSKCNNMCMDVYGAKAINGANIHCWPIHAEDNQRFKLEKFEDKPSANKPNRARKPRPNKLVKIKKNADKPSSSKPGDLKKSA